MGKTEGARSNSRISLSPSKIFLISFAISPSGSSESSFLLEDAGSQSERWPMSSMSTLAGLRQLLSRPAKQYEYQDHDIRGITGGTDQHVLLARENRQIHLFRGRAFVFEHCACLEATGLDIEPLGIQCERCEDFAEHAMDSSVVAFLQLGNLHSAVRGSLR